MTNRAQTPLFTTIQVGLSENSSRELSYIFWIQKTINYSINRTHTPFVEACKSGAFQGFKLGHLAPKKRIMPMSMIFNHVQICIETMYLRIMPTHPISLSMIFKHVQIRKETMFSIRNSNMFCSDDLNGAFRELNSGPLAPKTRTMPLGQMTLSMIKQYLHS